MHLTCRTCGKQFIIKSKGWMDEWLPRSCSAVCFKELMERKEYMNEIKVAPGEIEPFAPSDGVLGHRSGFEDKFSNICRMVNISSMHEPLKFFLSDKSAYVPDFLLYPTMHGTGKHGPIIEVKGLWKGDGKKKFKLFTKDYPHLNIFLIDEKMLSILLKGRAKT